MICEDTWYTFGHIIGVIESQIVIAVVVVHVQLIFFV
jgi:hypothetical protein